MREHWECKTCGKVDTTDSTDGLLDSTDGLLGSPPNGWVSDRIHDHLTASAGGVVKLCSEECGQVYRALRNRYSELLGTLERHINNALERDIESNRCRRA